ncbi:hypothetical protein BDV93DRAFT_561290 [Ceratobasidium sp. AG-I]|nr:hypothetical protein BDV93DRAFT_561290 [Ceratobasidium sp. AG-I]
MHTVSQNAVLIALKILVMGANPVRSSRLASRAFEKDLQYYIARFASGTHPSLEEIVNTDPPLHTAYHYVLV